MWVDEDKLSRGLPRVRKRAGDINGESGVHVCSGVGAVFGELSEVARIALWSPSDGILLKLDVLCEVNAGGRKAEAVVARVA